MTYIPISPKERDAMLETIGVKSLDDLFDAIPAKHRFPELNLPPALTEMEAMDELSGLAQANENVREDLVSFLGAGMYNLLPEPLGPRMPTNPSAGTSIETPRRIGAGPYENAMSAARSNP